MEREVEEIGVGPSLNGVWVDSDGEVALDGDALSMNILNGLGELLLEMIL